MKEALTMKEIVIYFCLRGSFSFMNKCLCSLFKDISSTAIPLSISVFSDSVSYCKTRKANKVKQGTANLFLFLFHIFVNDECIAMMFSNFRNFKVDNKDIFGN